jgi:histidinol phosphatase-like PHP family hydrolase
MHSIWSDGSQTFDGIAEAGLRLGYSYCAVTDHSYGLKIAPASVRIGAPCSTRLHALALRSRLTVIRRARTSISSSPKWPSRRDAWFALDSDAHATDELRYAEIAIAHARLAGVPRDRVVNCWPTDRLMSWLAERKAA